MFVALFAPNFYGMVHRNITQNILIVENMFWAFVAQTERQNEGCCWHDFPPGNVRKGA